MMKGSEVKYSRLVTTKAERINRGEAKSSRDDKDPGPNYRISLGMCGHPRDTPPINGQEASARVFRRQLRRPQT